MAGMPVVAPPAQTNLSSKTGNVLNSQTDAAKYSSGAQQKINDAQTEVTKLQKVPPQAYDGNKIVITDE